MVYDAPYRVSCCVIEQGVRYLATLSTHPCQHTRDKASMRAAAAPVAAGVGVLWLACTYFIELLVDVMGCLV